MKRNTLAIIAQVIDEAGILDDYFENYISVDDAADYNSFSDIFEELNQREVFKSDIPYLEQAQNYLKENDPSLSYSLKIADDLGFSPKDLNIYVLANIHAEQEAINDFYELEDDISYIIEEYE